MATDYSVPPGDYLKEWLDNNDVFMIDAASQLGWSMHRLLSFLLGHIRLSVRMAEDLERVTGTPVKYWLNIEELFIFDQIRLKSHDYV